MEMWNEKLTRENIENFYFSTCEMVFSSVYQMTKETTRAEQAIVKSYLDVYQQRAGIKGEDVLYVFGDILLSNAKDIIERYPLPENITTYSERNLDEYTRNFMHEKIVSKIDSTGFKVAEFISTDTKKPKAISSISKFTDVLPITPLLLFQLIIVLVAILGVSYLAVTIPYKSKPLVDSTGIFSKVSIEEEYVGILPYFPLNAAFPVQENVPNTTEGSETAPQESSETTTALGPVIATTEPSATMG